MRRAEQSSHESTEELNCLSAHEGRHTGKGKPTETVTSPGDAKGLERKQRTAHGVVFG